LRFAPSKAFGWLFLMYHQEASVILDTPIELQCPAADEEEYLGTLHFNKHGICRGRVILLILMFQ